MPACSWGTCTLLCSYEFLRLHNTSCSDPNCRDAGLPPGFGAAVWLGLAGFAEARTPQALPTNPALGMIVSLRNTPYCAV